MAEVSCGETVELPTEGDPAAVEVGSVGIPVLPLGSDELSTPVVAVPTAELLLGTAEVASAGLAVMPGASLLCDKGEVLVDVGREPLGTVAAPEAGGIPSVPGLIVGTAEESLSVIDELGLVGMLLELFLEVVEEEVYLDVRATVCVVVLESGHSVRTRVVVMILVLVE